MDEERERRVEIYADAILWYIEHPEAPLEDNLRAYVNILKKKLERMDAAEKRQQNN